LSAFRGNFRAAFSLFTDYHARKKAIDTFNTQNRWVKRGISIIPMKYHLGYFGTSHALVSIYHGDGSVSIAVGSIEMGQGLNTKVAQTAAYVLGVPLDKISVKPTNTLTSPNAILTGGSIGSEISCFVSLPVLPLKVLTRFPEVSFSSQPSKTSP
jgi:xanthine dehydrogenase/oxidase